MLLPLMVRGYAQIASTAYVHPASKMVAVRGITASEVAGVQSRTTSGIASDSEPHKISECGFSDIQTQRSNHLKAWLGVCEPDDLCVPPHHEERSQTPSQARAKDNAQQPSKRRSNSYKNSLIASDSSTPLG